MKFLLESRRWWEGDRKDIVGHPGADSEICPWRTLRDLSDHTLYDYLGGTAEALFRPMWMKEFFCFWANCCWLLVVGCGLWVYAPCPYFLI